MRFTDLAWGATAFAYATKSDLAYQALPNSASLLCASQTADRLAYFTGVRSFLTRYGVNYAPKNLADQYTATWPMLEPHIRRLSTQGLLSCNLTSSCVRRDIALVFRLLTGPTVWGGSTVASKVLHCFNSGLFAMWDLAIETEYRRRGVREYVDFLVEMQREAADVARDFAARGLAGTPEDYLNQVLEYTRPKSLAKYLDEYNWMTITNGWPKQVPSWLVSMLP